MKINASAFTCIMLLIITMTIKSYGFNSSLYSEKSIDTESTAISNKAYLGIVHDLTVERIGVNDLINNYNKEDYDRILGVLENQKSFYIDFMEIVPPDEFENAHKILIDSCKSKLHSIDISISMIYAVKYDDLDSEEIKSLNQSLSDTNKKESRFFQEGMGLIEDVKRLIQM